MRAYVFRFAPEKRTSCNAVAMSVSCPIGDVRNQHPIFGKEDPVNFNKDTGVRNGQYRPHGAILIWTLAIVN
jgi:hypothetical protein